MDITAKREINEFIYPPKTVTDSCHASTVLPLPDGNVVAAWFGGTKEGNDDVKIWVSVRENGKWARPYSIAVKGESLPHWNPVLFLRENGEIILYFKYGKPIPKWVTYYCISNDGGKSFSEPKVLVPYDKDGGRGPVKNKAIRLKDGTVIAPASKESLRGSWKCFVDISKDDGLSFEHSNFVLRPKKNLKTVNMIQPTLWENDKGIHMLVRTNSGYIYRSDSKDGGKTWCKAYETAMPNPNSGIDLVRLDNGILVLIMNPISENWGDRAPLVLMYSEDGVDTFTEFFKCEETTGDHEFSYPAITAVGNTLHITYTHEREGIVYQKIVLSF
ncbi:MAG: exo-alpha-sialidase [Acutalibacteraceae bacterium]